MNNMKPYHVPISESFLHIQRPLLVCKWVDTTKFVGEMRSLHTIAKGFDPRDSHFIPHDVFQRMNRPNMTLCNNKQCRNEKAYKPLENGLWTTAL